MNPKYLKHITKKLLMDKNIKRKLAIFLIILLQIISCRDKDPIKPGYQRKAPAPVNYWNSLDIAKDYLWAEPGSYWIYKNTATNDLDTQICILFAMDTIFKKGTTKETKHITVTYERIIRYIKSSFNQWIYYDKTIDFPPSIDGYTGYNYINRSVSGEGIIKPFIKPFNIGAKFGNGSSTTTCSSFVPTLTLQGKNYTNVALFDIDKDDIWERKLSCIRSNNIYYWAKDVGLIKKEMKTCNMSWELIEYNIIK